MPDSPGSDLVIHLGDLNDVDRGTPEVVDVLVFDGENWAPEPASVDWSNVTFGEVPEVPATPTAQQIVDALVELGLVTQAT